LLQRTLNLGILAHVDAGKTTLTERLLYAAGVIDEAGSVDAGTTQTDSLALERARGITIKAAVVSFPIDDLTVNLIDTPGHPDFIAEIERVLHVLDGAVLLVSAVEGVQPQTRILMRALRRLRVPTLIFVNKIDRPGATREPVLEAIAERLDLPIVPMATTRRLGNRRAESSPSRLDDAAHRSRLVEALAQNDEHLLRAFVDNADRITDSWLRAELAAQTRQALLHPVFMGSAITGAGVEHLMEGIAGLLPSDAGDAEAPLSGRVFKIERGPGGENVAYTRLSAGGVRARQRIPFGHGSEGRITSIGVFEHGSLERRTSASAGQIALLWGLDGIRIGDRVGTPAPGEAPQQFPLPLLETAVVVEDPQDRARAFTALGQLAEQDPLINVRRDDAAGGITVTLYGEVQKEVIQATLASDFGVEVTFRETSTLYVERPVRRGRAVEVLPDDENPFSATVGLQVAPGPIGSGVRFRTTVDPRRLPLYVYKTADNFSTAMTGYVAHTVEEGLRGWPVTDCVVTLDDCDYYIGDGRRKPTAPTPRTTAADFAKLTPMVLMQALDRAGTAVCEPMVRVTIEVPAATVGAVQRAVARLGGGVESSSVRGDLLVIEVALRAARARELALQLPGLTGGEGVLESAFDGYRPVRRLPPERRRTRADPRNRVEYLMEVRGRVSWGDPG
jgi:ribosomal protection tetracycline resistance protein